MPPRIEAVLLGGHHAVALDVSDSRAVSLWCAYDLAAVVESCFGAQTLPLGLAREPWLDRLGGTYLPPFPEIEADTARMFLLDEGQMAGTVALPRQSPVEAPLKVSCLYLRPESRGRGLASRALTALHSASTAAGGLGIQLDTHWPWQPAVHFYLRRRMWVMGWEQHLSFAWLAGRPPWDLEEHGDRLSLTSEGKARAEALRQGSRLLRFEAEDDLSGATLALNLAVRGWPLVREGGPHPDASVAPERLRSAIDLAESRARELGWVFPPA